MTIDLLIGVGRRWHSQEYEDLKRKEENTHLLVQQNSSYEKALLSCGFYHLFERYFREANVWGILALLWPAHLVLTTVVVRLCIGQEALSSEVSTMVLIPGHAYRWYEYFNALACKLCHLRRDGLHSTNQTHDLTVIDCWTNCYSKESLEILLPSLLYSSLLKFLFPLFCTSFNNFPLSALFLPSYRLLDRLKKLF